MEYFVTANGTTLHVSDSEKGEKSLLFLHGYLETLYIWEDFRELIPESFRFISHDKLNQIILRKCFFSRIFIHIFHNMKSENKYSNFAANLYVFLQKT
jgi:hypothetical protein